jgi:hypothetical protein
MYFVSQPIVTNGLLVYYDTTNQMSYTSGSNLIDLSGNNRTGTFPSGSSISSNPTLINFNPSTTRTPLNITNMPSLPINGWTVAMLVKPKLGGVTDFWNYWFFQNSGGGHQYTFGAFATTVGFSFKDEIDGVSLSRGFSDWGYLVFGVTSDYKSFISLNGEPKQYTATTGWTGGSNINFSSIFNRSDGSVGNASGWRADTQVFSIYNKELSQAEIQQNFNALKGRYGL